jgi:hypothetical protein
MSEVSGHLAENNEDLGNKEWRLAELDRHHQALTQIIEERAVAYADDPIGQLGLHSLRYRIRGSRKFPVLVEEYRLDRRLLRALLKIGKQAAIEMGQQGKAVEDAEKKKAEAQALMDRINAGRDRAAKEERERNAAAAAKGETQSDESLGKG